jgi:hypothetical protein
MFIALITANNLAPEERHVPPLANEHGAPKGALWSLDI